MYSSYYQTEDCSWGKELIIIIPNSINNTQKQETLDSTHCVCIEGLVQGPENKLSPADSVCGAEFWI